MRVFQLLLFAVIMTAITGQHCMATDADDCGTATGACTEKIGTEDASTNLRYHCLKDHDAFVKGKGVLTFDTTTYCGEWIKEWHNHKAKKGQKEWVKAEGGGNGCPEKREISTKRDQDCLKKNPPPKKGEK